MPCQSSIVGEEISASDKQSPFAKLQVGEQSTERLKGYIRFWTEPLLRGENMIVGMCSRSARACRVLGSGLKSEYICLPCSHGDHRFSHACS